jgi:membrane associated rhomboid family serine protease
VEPLSVAAIAAILGAFAWTAWRRTPLSYTLSFAVLVVFLLIFVDERVSDGRVFVDLAWRVGIFGNSEPWTFFTTMFVHAGPTHLIFNLLGFLLITPLLEERIGSLRLALVFLFGGAVGHLVFFLVRSSGPGFVLVGASGGLLAALGAFGRLYPRERMSFFFPPLILPAVPVIWVVVGYLLFSFVMTASAGASGVANEAHLGGLAFGFAAAPLIMRVEVKRTSKLASFDASVLEPLATTRELREIRDELKVADVPEVRSAWLDKFAAKAKCPRCGGPVRLGGHSLRSACGWKLRLGE